MTQDFHATGVSGPCPDVDTLADLHAGVLDASTAAPLRAHVDQCAACTDVIAALDATVLSLGNLPQVQIPPHVATQIDRALAAEAGRVDTGSELADSFAAAPPTAPSNVRRLETDRPQTAGPELRAQGGSPHEHGAGATNVASLSAHREKKAGRGRLLLAAAAAAAVIGGGTLILTQNDGGDAASNQADTSQTAEAPDNQAGEAPAQVQTFSSPADVLDRGAIENNEVSPEVAGQMAELSARNQCLSQIVPRPASAPEAVQAGTYQGDEAYAFVFPTNDPDVVEMIVVEAADCSTILHKETGPRN